MSRNGAARARPWRRRVPMRPRKGSGTRWAAVLVVAAAAVSLGGCSSARNDLGTGSSPCYVALAAATGAVHHQGHLHGVLLERTPVLLRQAPRLYRVAHAAGRRQVCLVAFTGRFAASAVDRALGQAEGDLAVVEVGYPDPQVLGTLLVTRQPFEFGHSHIFPL